MHFLPVLAFVAAAFTSALGTDTATYCGNNDAVAVGSQYMLYTNLWGRKDATSGSQCANLISLNGNTVSWDTTWTWTGGSGIKSFTNIALTTGLNKQLFAISNIPSTWHWSQTSRGTIVADVAYDLFTSSRAGGANEYEIMIWLANFNSKPLSYHYGADGKAIPVATGVGIAGTTWNVFSGTNTANAVLSFIPTSGTVTRFQHDLKDFLTYLINNQGLPSSQYLVTAQGGTEATSGGPVTLRTSAYSLAVN